MVPVDTLRAPLALLLLGACAGQPSGPECIGDPPLSVLVRLSDPQGEPIPDPVVTFSHDGQPPLPCGAQQEPPTSFVCGENLAGDFEITASGYGFETVTEQVQVQREGCWVVPVHLDLELDPLPCPDRTDVSVTVTVIDRSGNSVAGAAVSWATADEPEAACTQREPRVFLCGLDVVGPITLVASAPDMQTETQTVTVREDFCGMIPEERTIVLRP